MEISNRKAYHEYFFEAKYIAGMVLTGTEIKSLRLGKASFNDSYCYFVKGVLRKSDGKYEPCCRKLKMDPKFCAGRLSHLHPHDMKYLSLHDTFTWNKGSVFAMDRRYFHCSDNYHRRGLNQKRAIVLWTLS
jgi:hypothetical protein